MQKRILLIIIFLFLLFCLNYAQEDYFNLRIDLSQNSQYDIASEGALESDEGYIITGFTLDEDGRWCKGIGILNKDGSVKEIKTICFEEGSYITSNPGSLIRFSKDRYYSTGNHRIPTSTWVHDRGMLICYDNQMNPLWSRYFGEKSEPYDTAYLLRQLTKTFEEDIVLIGGWMPYGKEIRIWMAKTDSLGNLIWERSFGSGIGYYQGHSVVQTSDHGYAIGGYLFYIGDKFSGDPIVIKTDSLGNQEWFKNLGGPFKGNKAMLTLDNDGNIIVGTMDCEFQLDYDPESRINIIKLDLQGNIVWNKNDGCIKTDQ